MIQIKDIATLIESFAPTPYQESYDNSGLLIGNPHTIVNGILITLDTTEAVIEEAILKKCNLIVSHHPIIFSGIKKLNGNNYIEKTIIKALKHNIAIYAAHTNLDNIKNGVSFKMAEKLNLKNIKILLPKKNILTKLTTYSPSEYKSSILESLFSVGAGKIGNYSNCSFTSEGTGTYQPNNEAKPYEGISNITSEVNETKIEVMFPSHLENKIVSTLQKVHPYEEVAYYLQQLENYNQEVGSGAFGELENEIDEIEFIQNLKTIFNTEGIRYTQILNKPIKRVALCGGSGSFLLKNAIRSDADIFITADFKYHDYFDAENKILIADIGHYESEECTKEIFYEILSKNFSNIAILMGETVTKPYNYL